MRKVGMLSSVLLACLLASAPAFARWEVYPLSQIRFELPDNWAVETRGNVVVTRPVLPGLGLEFVSAPFGARQAAFEEGELIGSVARLVQGARITMRPRAVSQYGLRGVLFGGVGVHNGVQVEWFSVGLGDGRGHGVLALGFAAPGQLRAHLPALERIFNSIQPAAVVVR